MTNSLVLAGFLATTSASAPPVEPPAAATPAVSATPPPAAEPVVAASPPTAPVELGAPPPGPPTTPVAAPPADSDPSGASPPAAGPTATPPPAVVVVHDHPEQTRTVKVVEDTPRWTEWIGLHFGSVLTPFRLGAPFTPGKRITANRARACLDPGRVRYCGNVRGFDVRVSWSNAKGYWRAPRWLAYFRSGYTAGRFEFAGSEAGSARSLSYFSVPLFVGANLYLFDRFPLRPYGGLGAGFDIVTLQYARNEASSYNDVSARIGFELHGGIEARITNFFAVSAEVQQLWSARRRLSNLPDFSNGGLTFMVGASVSIPTRSPTRREVKTIERHVHHAD